MLERDKDVKAPASLPRARLAPLLKVSPNKYSRWCKEGLLDDSDPARAEDAARLALLARMISVAGPQRAKRAWRVIRPVLEGRDKIGSRRGWVLVDRELERDSIAFTARELAECLREEGQFSVIPLSPILSDARGAFGRHARKPSS
jgi:hypothetical protein